MDPLTIALMGLGGLGGFLGGRGRKPIDPALLARLFGPNALATDTQTLYNTLATSPMFSQLQSQASSMGARAGNASQAAFARAGLSNSGIGAVNSAISSQFGNDLMLRARAALWQQAQQQASQSLAGRMGLWGQSQLGYQNTPTMAQSFGNALTGMASTGLQAQSMKQPKAKTQTTDYSGWQLGPDGQYHPPQYGPWQTAPAPTQYGQLPMSAYPGTAVVSASMRRFNPTQRPSMFGY